MALLVAFLIAADEPTTLLVPPFRHTLGFHRVGRFYLELYLGRGFRIDDPQGMCGAKMVEEDNPSSGRDDHVLTLFAVNSGTGQIIYNVRLLKPGTYGSQGPGIGQFNRPHGICCNPQGDVYVADTDNNRVVRLRYAAGSLEWVGVLDSGLASPEGVDLDSRGRVYVTDTGNDQIAVYGSDGVSAATWNPGLDHPTAIAVLDPDADDNDFDVGCAIVIDREHTRVNQLSLSGQLMRQVDMRRIGLDEAGFSNCAFDRHGNVYVTDMTNSQVHMFDPALKYIVSFGRPGEFDSPRGIAIGRRFGQVFINEASGGQYYWIGLDGYMIGCYPQSFDSRKPGSTIALYVTEVADVTVSITDSSGRAARTLTPPHKQRPGEVLIVWDGKDDGGEVVSAGEYEIKVTIKPTYSRPRRTFTKELVDRVRRVPDR